MRLAALLTVMLSGCNWIELGVNAASYDTLRAGEAGNVVVGGDAAFVTLGDSGFAVVDANTGQRIAVMKPPAGTGSVDDVAVSDDFLFVLDARPPGFLSVLALSDPRRPRLVDQPRSVGVGPFSGVSARNGLCVVSGGTSRLTAWRYGRSGELEILDSADLGRGQPDVLVASNGRVVWSSTHYWGPYFGVDALTLDAAPARLRAVGRAPLPDAGFTPGGAKPANFPIDVAQLDDTTLLVAHKGGLSILDVARSERPRRVRLLDLGGPAVSVDVLERAAAVSIAGRRPGAVVLDFGQPEPRVVRRVTFAPGTKPAAVALSTRNVLVAARDQGLLVVQR